MGYNLNIFLYSLLHFSVETIFLEYDEVEFETYDYYDMF